MNMCIIYKKCLAQMTSRDREMGKTRARQGLFPPRPRWLPDESSQEIQHQSQGHQSSQDPEGHSVGTLHRRFGHTDRGSLSSHIYRGRLSSHIYRGRLSSHIYRGRFSSHIYRDRDYRSGLRDDGALAGIIDAGAAAAGAEVGVGGIHGAAIVAEHRHTSIL